MLSKNELKFIKSLKVKKYRVFEKRFLVEGSKNVLELLSSNFKVDMVLCSKEFFEAKYDVLSRMRTEVLNQKTLQSVGSFTTNTSCIALAQIQELAFDDIDFKQQIFVLDGVNDPGNLGTIIRTLNWFGFSQVICSQHSAELYNPKVISSTMGSFTNVKVWYHDLEDFFNSCPLPTYGADMNGQNVYEALLEKPSVVVMGNESHGISELVKQRLSLTISVPKYGKAESLNVGVVTGIIAGYLRMS